MVAVGDMTLERDLPGVVTLLTSKLRWEGADTAGGECNNRTAGDFGKLFRLGEQSVNKAHTFISPPAIFLLQ